MNSIPTVSKILKDISSISRKSERVAALRSHYPNKALLTLLKFAFDPKIQFLLPEGAPPYTPSKIDTDNTLLYSEMRRMYIFIDPKLRISQAKREILFIEILESIDPKDAELLIAVKDKKIPYRGITKALVMEAFPGLISEEQNHEQDKEKELRT